MEFRTSDKLFLTYEHWRSPVPFNANCISLKAPPDEPFGTSGDVVEIEGTPYALVGWEENVFWGAPLIRAGIKRLPPGTEHDLVTGVYRGIIKWDTIRKFEGIVIDGWGKKLNAPGDVQPTVWPLKRLDDDPRPTFKG
ncbi:hypothetical protein [Oleiharenicola lentus]|uniref:hypothetical protein n=1 Tax=Oleiharenicola lentus TaxID=2508720 RepID=UPI003F679419